MFFDLNVYYHKYEKANNKQIYTVTLHKILLVIFTLLEKRLRLRVCVCEWMSLTERETDNDMKNSCFLIRFHGEQEKKQAHGQILLFLYNTAPSSGDRSFSLPFFRTRYINNE